MLQTRLPQHFKLAIVLFIECYKFGCIMPTVKKRIMFQSDDDLDEALKACAEAEDRSVSSLIVSVMREHLIQKGFLEAKKPMKTKTDRKT
jgi:hypothetical protein